MASLKYLPFAGFGMWFFEFIFLERKLALDRKNILNSMSKLRELVPNDPLFLLLFPEGTLNTPNNRANTRAFAKKNDITIDPEFVLLPKATGLFMAVESLPRVDTLFDVTVGYNGLTREQVPFAEYLVENCYFAGKYPTVVHLHIRRFNVRQVPGFDGKITDENFERTEMKKEMADAFDPLTNARKDAFGLWVRDRWMEKDELMRGFYKTGAFPSSKQDVEWELKPSTTDVLLVLFAWTCLFFFGWAFFSALFSSCWMLVKLAFRVAKK